MSWGGRSLARWGRSQIPPPWRPRKPSPPAPGRRFAHRGWSEPSLPRTLSLHRRPHSVPEKSPSLPGAPSLQASRADSSLPPSLRRNSCNETRTVRPKGTIQRHPGRADGSAGQAALSPVTKCVHPRKGDPPPSPSPSNPNLRCLGICRLLSFVGEESRQAPLVSGLSQLTVLFPRSPTPRRAPRLLPTLPCLEHGAPTPPPQEPSCWPWFPHYTCAVALGGLTPGASRSSDRGFSSISKARGGRGSPPHVAPSAVPPSSHLPLPGLCTHWAPLDGEERLPLGGPDGPLIHSRLCQDPQGRTEAGPRWMQRAPRQGHWEQAGHAAGSPGGPGGTSAPALE